MTYKEQCDLLRAAQLHIGGSMNFWGVLGVGFATWNDANAFVELAELPFKARIVERQGGLEWPYIVTGPLDY